MNENLQLPKADARVFLLRVDGDPWKEIWANSDTAGGKRPKAEIRSSQLAAWKPPLECFEARSPFDSPRLLTECRPSLNCSGRSRNTRPGHCGDDKRAESIGQNTLEGLNLEGFESTHENALESRPQSPLAAGLILSTDSKYSDTACPIRRTLCHGRLSPP